MLRVGDAPTASRDHGGSESRFARSISCANWSRNGSSPRYRTGPTNTIQATPPQVNANISHRSEFAVFARLSSDPTIPQPILTSDIEALLRPAGHDDRVRPDRRGAENHHPRRVLPDSDRAAARYSRLWQLSGYNYNFAGFNQVSTGSSRFYGTISTSWRYRFSRKTSRPKACPVGVADAPISVANLVFGDYFVLIARQMVQALQGDGLRDYKYPIKPSPPGETSNDVVAWANTTGKFSRR